MTDLDNRERRKAVDPGDMLRRIDGLPDQLSEAWELAQKQAMPDGLEDVRQVVITGMGGSAIGGDLLAALASRTAPLPISVVRGYELPAWAKGKESLVVVCSFSGNTEETLAAYEQATKRDTTILGIFTGGKLAERMAKNGHPFWRFSDEAGPPRAALGWSLGLLIGLAARAGWLGDFSGDDIARTVVHLKEQQKSYMINVPTTENMAKRLAGHLVGCLPLVVGSGIFEPVAKRWKAQFNENANTWSAWVDMPEMNHNAVVGISHPRDLMNKQYAVFITSATFDHPRVRLRHQLTADLFLKNAIMVEKFEPAGETALEQMMHAVLYGDYVSYYVALVNGADPMDIWPIDQIKAALAEQA